MSTPITTTPLPHSELLELKRWNTPTVYNGWEQLTSQDRTRAAFNLEETRDFMPQMGPMVGYAVTLKVELSNPAHAKANPNAWVDYYRYVASQPGPKIVVVQDLDKPRVVGSFWGEVTSNTHRALGCVGTLTDGAVRDLDEMTNAGFKALARRLAVGHAYACPVTWGQPVEVFGQSICPGQLIHADKHGFLAIPSGEEKHLLRAARFMDSNECQTVIAAARGMSGLTVDQMIEKIGAAGKAFRDNAQAEFSRSGEW